jgi:hypothetical protein
MTRALSALLRLRERTLVSGRDGLVWLSVNGRDHRILVALSPPHLCSRLVMAGADPRTVAELLRDKTLHMAMRYSHLAPDFTLEAVRGMELKFQPDSTSVAPEPNSASELVH